MHEVNPIDHLRRSAEDVMRSHTWKRSCRGCRPSYPHTHTQAHPRPIDDEGE